MRDNAIDQMLIVCFDGKNEEMEEAMKIPRKESAARKKETEELDSGWTTS